MEKTRKRDVLYIFFISVFFQSSTLYADIQPRIESIVHSHLIKYWYYGYEENIIKISGIKLYFR